MKQRNGHPERASLQALVARGPLTRPIEDAAPPSEDERPITVETVAVAAPSPTTAIAPRRPARPSVSVTIAAIVVALVVLAADRETEPTAQTTAITRAAADTQPTTAVAADEALAAAHEPVPTQPDAEGEEELLVIEDDDQFDAMAPVAGSDDDASERRQRARAAARVATEKAQAAQRTGDRATAIRHYGDALAALPTYAPAAAGLSKLYYDEGSYKRALAHAKQAHRSAPRSLSYMLLVGDAYARLDRPKDARAMWRRAAELGSTRAEERLATQ